MRFDVAIRLEDVPWKRVAVLGSAHERFVPFAGGLVLVNELPDALADIPRGLVAQQLVRLRDVGAGVGGVRFSGFGVLALEVKRGVGLVAADRGKALSSMTRRICYWYGWRSVPVTRHVIVRGEQEGGQLCEYVERSVCSEGVLRRCSHIPVCCPAHRVSRSRAHF